MSSQRFVFGIRYVYLRNPHPIGQALTGIRMSRKPQSKDEALEALDFIVNVLKEHEKDLDRLISELGTVTEAIGATGELTSKVEKVEERIAGLQNEITNLVGYLSNSPREQAPAPAALQKETPKPEIAPTIPVPVQA